MIKQLLMKSQNRTLTISSEARTEILDITSQIKEIVAEINLSEGLLLLHSMHTTTAIIINENESRLKKDIEKVLDILFSNREYMHDQIDNNADSHLKSIFLSQSQVVPVSESQMILGTWQRILFVELDGPRTRKIFVQAIST